MMKLVIYLTLSIVVGIMTIIRANNIRRYFNNVSSGDYGCYEAERNVLTVLNWMFVPSLLVYGFAVIIGKFSSKSRRC